MLSIWLSILSRYPLSFRSLWAKLQQSVNSDYVCILLIFIFYKLFKWHLYYLFNQLFFLECKCSKDIHLAVIKQLLEERIVKGKQEVLDKGTLRRPRFLPGEEGKRSKCRDCKTKDRKTRYFCQHCKKWLCLEHVQPLCLDCFLVWDIAFKSPPENIIFTPCHHNALTLY